MLVPSINFTEQNIGTVPILPGVRNRIGIVGEFSRGPANVARFIGGYTDFADTYGSDIAPGSLGFQAAWDQGARNFMVTRVLGNSRPAAGSVSFTGIATKVNTLYLNLSFIGEAIDQNTSLAPLITPVVTSGTYTGNVSGRYYFYVSAVTSTVATVKYQFVPIGGTLVAWAGITNSIAITLATDAAVAKVVAAGVSVAFGSTGPVSLAVGNSFSVRTNSFIFSSPVNQDDIPSQIAGNLANAISGYDPFGTVTAEAGDVVFALNPGLTDGVLGNRYKYFFTLADTVSPGFTTTNLTSANVTTFQGGVDGPRIAFRDFYSYSGVPLLRLEALSEGGWGNDVAVTIVPITNSQFRVTVSDLKGSTFNPQVNTESFLVSFSNTDPLDNYSLTDLKNSRLVKGYFLPQFSSPTAFDTALLNKSPLRLAPADASVTDVTLPSHPDSFGPTYLTNVSLRDGYDGPELTDNDYINGLSKLEGQPVHIVITPGQYKSKFVKQALISHCLKASTNDGLRIAILNTKPFLSPNQAKLESQDFNSNRALMVTGWATYAGQPNAPRFGLSPDAVYAGKIAAIGFWVQPQAITSSGPAVNIVEVDNQNNNSEAALQIYTDARLEVLTLSNVYQAFYLVNGRMLSEGTFLKISTRRTFDVLRMDINDALKLYLSEPHSFLLRRQIVTGITTYLSERQTKGHIANFTTPVCDNSNNPASNYSNGVLNVSFSFLDIAAADYIQVTVSRDNTLGLTQIGV